MTRSEYRHLFWTDDLWAAPGSQGWSTKPQYHLLGCSAVLCSRKFWFSDTIGLNPTPLHLETLMKREVEHA